MSTADEMRYALAKQIPAMERGFVVDTVYGQIVVEAGPLADHLAKMMTGHFRLELMRAEAAQHLAQREAQGVAA